MNKYCRRVLYALCFFGLFLSHSIYFNVDTSTNQLALDYRPNLVLFSYRSATLKVPIVKQQKHGASVVALPFDASVTLPAYFALCCDVHSNPAPTLLDPSRLAVQTYTRDKLLHIGKSLYCAKVRYTSLIIELLQLSSVIISTIGRSGCLVVKVLKTSQSEFRAEKGRIIYLPSN